MTTYKELSTPLKTAIIISYILGIINGLFFLYGFVSAATEVIK